ncbi:insulin-like peptide 3 [Cochliomyia hominivorax]
MKFFYILILFVVLYEANAASKRLCGRILVQVLESVCINGYNSHPTKRSDSLLNQLEIGITESDITDNSNNSFLDDLLTESHVNTMAVTRRRRNLLGIYDECCVKGCTLDNLALYFNAASKRLCGRILVQVLESVCINGYNSHPTKRSGNMTFEYYNGNYLLTENHISAMAMTRRRRNLLGIYDECCVKGCTLDNLALYCK